MNILVINAGSVTIKFKLFSSIHTNSGFKELISGIIDNKNNIFFFKLQKENKIHEWEISKQDFFNSANLILKELAGIEIHKIGFRIVHGGEKYTSPTLLTKDIITELENLNELAPLHNPPALQKVKEFNELLPDIPKFGVFDTAFHSTIPKKSFLYALPYEFYEKYKIRRYGFHGISHKYIFNELVKLEKNTAKVISCHLGGGASITAIEKAKSIDTSMGFTPLEGLIMATRPGDVDDGVLYYLMEKEFLTVKDMRNVENNLSGIYGISGISSDMRILLEKEKKGDERAHLAIEMYIYRIQKYIGSYVAAMNGLDALIFTAGVGAGSDVIRKRICENLKFVGITIDDSINNGRINVDENLKISTNDSTAVWVIPTNEELQIANEIKN